MRFFVITLLYIFIPCHAFLQHLLPLNNQVRYRYEAENYKNPKLHSALKPFYTKSQTINSELFGDTTTNTGRIFSSDIFSQNKNLHVKLIPIIQFTSNYYKKSFLYNTKTGISAKASWKKKHGFYLEYFNSWISMPEFMAQRADSTKVVPYFGRYTSKTNGIYRFENLSYYWFIRGGKYFNVILGKGKNFVGDGYRSLLLSDNANNYPYIKLDIAIWKFRYWILYSFLKDVNTSDNRFIFENKYITTHVLSYNITPTINAGLFESVIWNGGKSSGYRGFEVNYLNPVIFFRPVEYSLNAPSPDNVLLGGFYKFRLLKKIFIYGQLLIDDFNFEEFKKRNGYWGNKIAWQQGIHVFGPLGIQNLQVTIENNLVRPFTYAHITSLDNYGNYYQPLAHPLGANFNEIVGFLHYFKNRLSISQKVLLAKSGIGNKNYNSGQNIYIPYTFRESDYGYDLYNGELVKYRLFETKFGWMLYAKWQLQMEAGFTFRLMQSSSAHTRDVFINIGFKTLLYNEDMEY